MKKHKSLQGFSQHIEFLKIPDSPRDRRRCVYYVKDDKMCTVWNGHCKGASHCMEYKEKVIEKSLIQKSKSQLKNESKENTTKKADFMPNKRLIGKKITFNLVHRTGKIIYVKINRLIVVYDDEKDNKRCLAYPDRFIHNIVSIEVSGKETVERDILEYNGLK